MKKIIWQTRSNTWQLYATRLDGVWGLGIGGIKHNIVAHFFILEIGLTWAPKKNQDWT